MLFENLFLPPIGDVLGALLLTLGLCKLMLLVMLRLPKQRLIWDIPDRPNAMHISPTLRVGGLAIGFSVICAVMVFANRNSGSLLLPLMIALALMLVSVFDDRWQLSAAIRLAVHVAAAVLVTLFWVRGLLTQMPGNTAMDWLLTPLGAVMMVLVITWATNLYNFMDGADGIAGGMAVFGFGSYAILALMASLSTGLVNAAMTAVVSAAIAGAGLGFLVFNFPPAKIFMGDAGSIPLGFLAAVIGIHGVLSGLWAWFIPMLVFSPFIVDATITLLKRLWKRKTIWHAHREHYYQRLILAGWSHRRTALAYYVLMCAASLCAVAAQSFGGRVSSIGHVILLTWVVIYALLLIALERRFGK